MANYVLVLALGLASGSISGIIGTGASSGVRLQGLYSRYGSPCPSVTAKLTSSPSGAVSGSFQPGIKKKAARIVAPDGNGTSTG